MNISKNPGLLLVLLAWWAVPFLVMALLRYPRFDYLLSFVPFIVVFLVFGSLGLAFHMWNKRSGSWSELGAWKRYFILMGTYALAAISTVILVAGLDSAGLARHFGGDAGGSFALLFFPSIVFYAVMGAGLAVLSKIDKRYE